MTNRTIRLDAIEAIDVIDQLNRAARLLQCAHMASGGLDLEEAAALQAVIYCAMRDLDAGRAALEAARQAEETSAIVKVERASPTGPDAELFAAIEAAREAKARAVAAADDSPEADTLDSEEYEAGDRVAKTPARTFSGLLAKLALVAPDFDAGSTSELPAEMGTSPAILFSIAVDYKALAGAIDALEAARKSGEPANV
jgi:hypothetical protein